MYSDETKRWKHSKSIPNLTKKARKMDNIIATPMSLSELANAYDVSNKIMKKWLNPHQTIIGKRVGLLYTPKQVSKIYDCLGYPPYLDVK